MNKGYVDSLVGQYSGGYNLFFNYSVVDGIYRSLGQTVITATQQIIPITTDTTNQLVASFVSSALGITSIPSGIWNVLVFSEVASIGGTLTYFYELYKLTGITETLIFTSGTSSDVNATTTPTAYNISGTLTAPYTLLLTDKIVIKIYLHKDGTPQLVNTYFQNNYYSFTQTTLNAGTTLLSSTNNWSGQNTFTQPSAFTSTLQAITQATNTNTTAVATTQWANNYFGALAGAVWTGTQNFTGATLTALTQLSNTNTTAVATTQWANTYFGAKAGAVWTGTQNFTSATLTALTQLTNTNTTAVATTQWTNTYYAPKASPTFSGTVSLGTVSNLTLGLNQFTTLSANTTLPTSSQLGYYVETQLGTTYSITTGSATIATVNIPAGTWLIEINITYGALAVGGYFSLSLSTSNNNPNLRRRITSPYIGGTRLSTVIALTTATDHYIVCNASGSITADNLWYIRTRIA